MNSYGLSRTALVMIWIYHGLIPKLIFQHVTELELIERGPILVTPYITLLVAGGVEVLLGLCVLVFWNRTWPVYVSLVAFIMLFVGAVAISPDQAAHAFNPVTLTLSAIFFCLIQLNEVSSKTRDRG